MKVERDLIASMPFQLGRAFATYEGDVSDYLLSGAYEAELSKYLESHQRLRESLIEARIETVRADLQGVIRGLLSLDEPLQKVKGRGAKERCHYKYLVTFHGCKTIEDKAFPCLDSIPVTGEEKQYWELLEELRRRESRGILFGYKPAGEPIAHRATAYEMLVEIDFGRAEDVLELIYAIDMFLFSLGLFEDRLLIAEAETRVEKRTEINERTLETMGIPREELLEEQTHGKEEAESGLGRIKRYVHAIAPLYQRVKKLAASVLFDNPDWRARFDRAYEHYSRPVSGGEEKTSRSLT